MDGSNRAVNETDKIVSELVAHMTRGLSGSWHMQDVAERKRRLTFVVQMSALLDGLRKAGVMMMAAWAEWAVEAVITGDLPALKAYGVDGLSEAHLVWSYSGQEGRALAELYAPFREIAQQAYLSALPRETV